MDNLNSNFNRFPYRPSSFEYGFYARRNSPEIHKPEERELPQVRAPQALSQVDIPPDLKNNAFFKEFQKARSSEALIKLFGDLTDQLNPEPSVTHSENQSHTNSPELKFYHYLKSSQGSMDFEGKISQVIQFELKKIKLLSPYNPETPAVLSFEKNINQLFQNLQSLELNQAAQMLLKQYNQKLNAPIKQLNSNINPPSLRQPYPFELSFTEQIRLLLMTDPNYKEELELAENMGRSQDLWRSGQPEVFEHDHLRNLLDIHSPSQASREKQAVQGTSTISNTINQLIEREDFHNVDSLKILNAYLTGTATNHQTEVNKLLNKSLSFYFENFESLTLHENLLNLTNLFQVAASKELIPIDKQKALGENFLKTFEDITPQKPGSLEPRLRFLLSSTTLNTINNEKYSTFISENMDSIKEIIAKNPIFIINNLNLGKVDPEVKDELQLNILAEIKTQKHHLDTTENSTAEEISQNPEFAQFPRTVLAAADKGFITKEELKDFLPDHLQVREKIKQIEQIEALNLLASKTDSADEEEKGGIDNLIEEILDQASEEGEKFNPKEPKNLFILNLEIISTLQDVKNRDPVHFRSLITQSLDPESFMLPEEFEEEPNPFNHLLLTKAFCDPTKTLYREHDSTDFNLRESLGSFDETKNYINGVIKTYKSESWNRARMRMETEPKSSEEHHLNQELILELINAASSFNGLDVHHQSIESITDVYFNLLDNHYLEAANHLLEGEIVKAFTSPNDGQEIKSDEFKQHLLKIYDFAREERIIADITSSYPALKPLLDQFRKDKGPN
jgi:hypothetical protein